MTDGLKFALWVWAIVYSRFSDWWSCGILRCIEKMTLGEMVTILVTFHKRVVCKESPTQSGFGFFTYLAHITLDRDWIFFICFDSSQQTFFQWAFNQIRQIENSRNLVGTRNKAKWQIFGTYRSNDGCPIKLFRPRRQTAEIEFRYRVASKHSRLQRLKNDELGEAGLWCQEKVAC